MQFGRFHGIALLALGALLLIVQTVVIFEEKSPSAETTDSSQQPPAAERNGRPQLPPLDYLPGVLGVVIAGAGALVLAKVSHQGTRKRREEERRQEDRSFGRQGHHVSTPTIWKDR